MPVNLCTKGSVTVSGQPITCWNTTQNHPQSAYDIDIYQATLLTPSTVYNHHTCSLTEKLTQTWVNRVSCSPNDRAGFMACGCSNRRARHSRPRLLSIPQESPVESTSLLLSRPTAWLGMIWAAVTQIQLSHCMYIEYLGKSAACSVRVPLTDRTHDISSYTARAQTFTFLKPWIVWAFSVFVSLLCGWEILQFLFWRQCLCEVKSVDLFFSWWVHQFCQNKSSEHYRASEARYFSTVTFTEIEVVFR